MRRVAVAFTLVGLGSGCVGLDADAYDPAPLSPPARVPVLAAPYRPLPAPKPAVLPASYSTPAELPQLRTLPPTRWRDLYVCRELVRRKGQSAVVLAETPPPTPEPPRLTPEPPSPPPKPSKPAVAAKDGELNWQPVEARTEPEPRRELKAEPPSPPPKPQPTDEPVEWAKPK